MRRTTMWVAAAVVSVLSARAGAEETAPKAGWEGFGAGSSCTTKITNATSMPGMPAAPPQSTEMKQTLVKVTDEAWTVSTEMKVGGVSMPAQETVIPRKVDPKALAVEKPVVEDLGKEKVTIEGKDYECVKQRTTVAGSTTLTWTHAQHGTLKFEGATPGGGATAMVVTKLSTKATIAGKSLDCREERMSTKAAGTEMEILTLRCDAIPGRVARIETASKMGPVTMQSVNEVTAFEAK